MTPGLVAPGSVGVVVEVPAGGFVSVLGVAGGAACVVDGAVGACVVAAGAAVVVFAGVVVFWVVGDVVVVCDTEEVDGVAVD